MSPSQGAHELPQPNKIKNKLPMGPEKQLTSWKRDKKTNEMFILSTEDLMINLCFIVHMNSALFLASSECY